ncbi:histidine kinase [Bacillus sp. C28GYM-DRY-1]|uniref:histidine kinase n=1 Tax=Bacillus sp. C28GYM-DRY-1 TaxID=3062686 RepID=UPI002676C73A|nr:histidine kinase [Bacillus sp. C28GYM-DRY-1]MDO3660642.1 histidine kinase [Bacillus sp. C28GYM-DRY-1]
MQRNINVFKYLSLALIILSFIYVIYLSYISVFNIFVGADVKINEQGKLEVTNVVNYTDEYYSGVKKGDIILEVNGEKGSEVQLESGRLVNVESLIVERDNKSFHLQNVSLISEENLFMYLIPIISYSICLFCIFFVYRINKVRKSSSAFVLILFLLFVSVAYVSACGARRGEEVSTYLLLLTLVSCPILYIHFIYKYFVELGTKLFKKRILIIMYMLPIINLLLEAVMGNRLNSSTFLSNLNLISFFVLVLTVSILIHQGVRKIKHNEQKSILKVLSYTSILAFSPFIIFFAIPYVLFNTYLSPFSLAAFTLVIPFSLVYQFMTNRLYNIDFVVGRLKYYGFLAITPTVIVVTIFNFVQKPKDNFYSVKLTIVIYLLMFAVFYFKEIIDFRFKLKRFTEKFNYQDGIFKFTQLIKQASSVDQVLIYFKNAILEVLNIDNACVFDNSKGEITLLSKNNYKDITYKKFEKYAQHFSGDIGKIVEFKQGFIIKIGERGDRSFLVLCFSSYNTFKLTRDEIAWLQTLAFYTNVSLENVMKIEELMVHLEDSKQQESNPVWLKKLMYTIEEKQRSELARDLHDSVLQDLISLKRQCELFLAGFKKDDNPCQEEVKDKLVQMNEQMSDVISMTRETCHELRPQLLYDLGLVKALSKLVAQQQERVPFHIRLNTDRFTASLDLDSQLNLYRIIQEFLSNAVKHSQATDVLIMLISIQNKIVLHYEDDGVGFDQEKTTEHSMSMGLSGIKERVRALDGRLRIETSEGKGFKADIEIEL